MCSMFWGGMARAWGLGGGGRVLVQEIENKCMGLYFDNSAYMECEAEIAGL